MPRWTKQEPKTDDASVEAPKEVAKEIAVVAPKSAALTERVEKLEKCLVLICNEIGLRLGEPLKSNFAHIILTGNEPSLRKK